MRSPLRQVQSGFLLCIASLLVACGGDSGTGPSATASIAGVWNLKTINGQSLPFVFGQTGANKQEITSETYTLTADGSFTQIIGVRTTFNGQVTTQSEPDAGTYTLNGTAVTFRYLSDGSSATGSWSGNTLTIAADGFAAVYQR